MRGAGCQAGGLSKYRGGFSARLSDKADVISLKRYIDSNAETVLPAAADSYRAVLAAMARSGSSVCPQAGGEFARSLLALKDRVTAEASARVFAETGKCVEEELARWTQAACEYVSRTTVEACGLVRSVAESVNSLAERDQRYAGQFTGIGERLRQVAALDDVQQMRASLSESIRLVNDSVERMVREGEQSVARLKAQVDSYQAKLAESEQLALHDSLTGLENRRGVERHMEMLMARGQAFSVILIDLNGFKQVNDGYGHLAGDHLLQQFASELRPLFRPVDTVGRWGGDEFIVIAGCESGEVEALVGRIRQWVFGDYTVDAAGGPVKVRLDGAIGVTSYRPGEPAAALVRRADEAMYRDKAARRNNAG